MEDGAGRSWARSSDGRRVRHPLQIGTVGSTVMSWLSVRQLWLMCRVSKTLREFAIKELRAMPQPLVGGGVPGGLETNSLELLSLANVALGAGTSAAALHMRRRSVQHHRCWRRAADRWRQSLPDTR